MTTITITLEALKWTVGATNEPQGDPVPQVERGLWQRLRPRIEALVEEEVKAYRAKYGPFE